MIGEDNHKRQGGHFSSSTTQNFISLSQLLTQWQRFRHYVVGSLIHNVRNHIGKVMCKFQIKNTNIVFTNFCFPTGQSPLKK